MLLGILYWKLESFILKRICDAEFPNLKLDLSRNTLFKKAHMLNDFDAFDMSSIK